MDTIYKPISKTVSFLSESVTTQKRKQDATKFMSEAFPVRRRKEELEALKNKAQVLDSVKKKWKRNSKKHVRNILSCQDRKKLKVFDIKPEGHKFEDNIPLHRLWQDYMRDTINIHRLKTLQGNQNRQVHERLMKADYHGCMLVVRKTKCPSYLGTAGIVLMETRNTFKIVTKDDKIKCIPKANSVFAFELDGLLFTIYGNQFMIKTSERVKRHFKMKSTIDIS